MTYTREQARRGGSSRSDAKKQAAAETGRAHFEQFRRTEAGVEACAVAA